MDPSEMCKRILNLPLVLSCIKLIWGSYKREISVTLATKFNYNKIIDDKENIRNSFKTKGVHEWP